MRRFIGISAKLRLTFLVIIVIITAIVFSVVYTAINYICNYFIAEKVRTVTHMASRQIDIEKQNLLKSGDEDSDFYISEVKHMRDTAKSFDSVDSIYTFVYKNDKYISFLIDTAEGDGAKIGEDYKMLPEMARALNGEDDVITDIYSDKWGTFVSGFRPLLDHSGKVIGAVGIDIEVSYIKYFKNIAYIVAGIIMMLLLVIFILYEIFALRRVTVNINRLLYRISDIAENSGDLTQTLQLNSNDEIRLLADKTNKFINNIRNVIFHINSQSCDLERLVIRLRETSTVSSTVSRAVTASVEEVSTVASELANNAMEGKAVVLGITGRIDHFSILADKVYEDVNKNITFSRAGLTSVRAMWEKSREGVKITELVELAIDELNLKSQKIGKITELMNSVADSTHLLAINACIEAENAGAAGKSFAVVAKDVGKLAESSREYVKEIDQIAYAIKQELNATIMIMKKLKGIIESQNVSIGSAEELLNNIVFAFDNIISDYDNMMQTVVELADGKDKIDNIIESAANSSKEFAECSSKILTSMRKQTNNVLEVDELAQKASDITKGLMNEVQKFKF